jgi:hypothetical protein
MLIQILKDTSIRGVAVKAGQVVDTEQSDAIALINMGKAQPAPIVEPVPAVCPQPSRKPPRKRTNGNLSADT